MIRALVEGEEAVQEVGVVAGDEGGAEAPHQSILPRLSALPFPLY